MSFIIYKDKIKTQETGFLLVGYRESLNLIRKKPGFLGKTDFAHFHLGCKGLLYITFCPQRLYSVTRNK
jgi:hypothetical protein